jgi:hypothetical protein
MTSLAPITTFPVTEELRARWVKLLDEKEETRIPFSAGLAENETKSNCQSNAYTFQKLLSIRD